MIKLWTIVFLACSPVSAPDGTAQCGWMEAPQKLVYEYDTCWAVVDKLYDVPELESIDEFQCVPENMAPVSWEAFIKLPYEGEEYANNPFYGSDE